MAPAVNVQTAKPTFAQISRTPAKGNHVKVKGVVRDVAMFGGQPLGLHLEERSLDVKRK